MVGLVVDAAVLAGPVVDADVVLPVVVHEAVVAVAERTGTDGILARAWHLHDAGALVQHGRAVVLVVVVVAAVVRMMRREELRRGISRGLDLRKLAFDGLDGRSGVGLLDKDGVVGCDEEGSDENEGLHLLSN